MTTRKERAVQEQHALDELHRRREAFHVHGNKEEGLNFYYDARCPDCGAAYAEETIDALDLMILEHECPQSVSMGLSHDHLAQLEGEMQRREDLIRLGLLENPNQVEAMTRLTRIAPDPRINSYSILVNEYAREITDLTNQLERLVLELNTHARRSEQRANALQWLKDHATTNFPVLFATEVIDYALTRND